MPGGRTAASLFGVQRYRNRLSLICLRRPRLEVYCHRSKTHGKQVASAYRWGTLLHRNSLTVAYSLQPASSRGSSHSISRSKLYPLWSQFAPHLKSTIYFAKVSTTKNYFFYKNKIASTNRTIWLEIVRFCSF